MIKSVTICLMAIVGVLFGISSFKKESRSPQKMQLYFEYENAKYITQKAEAELILNRRKRHDSQILKNLEIANGNLEYAQQAAKKINR